VSITIEDLKRELSERDYRMLTSGDDAVAERAISKARVWVIARFKRCGEKPDFEDEIVREALLKRALYELYSYAENEKTAQDKKEDADDLLKGVLGDCAGGKEEEGYEPVAVSVRPGEPSGLAKEFEKYCSGGIQSRQKRG
jgi:hypothetical protein